MSEPSKDCFSHETLRAFCRDALDACGVDSFSSACTADGLVDASLRGVDSHGIHLLAHYVQAIRGKRINPRPDFRIAQTSPTTAILNADHSLGFPAGTRAMELAVKLAKEHGVGCISVTESTHGGMLAYYVLPAARQGFLAMTTTNTTPRLIPPGATRQFLGTNPICYAVPLQDEDPLCFDAATTMITGNKVKLHRQLGLPLPPDVAADKEGRPTTDPAAAELLYAFGGYKGFGLSLLVDLLCGVLAGMPNSDRVSAMYGNSISEKRHLGQFFLALDISRFRDLVEFRRELQDEVVRLRALPPQSDGESVLAPGDPEKEYEKQRREHGIPLPGAVVGLLDSVARDTDISPLMERQ